MPAIIILAAGASTRMGQPKQLLTFNNKLLIQHTIDTALATGIEAILLVLGAGSNKILPLINSLGIKVLINDDWREGMASSIRLGINTLQQKYPPVDGVIFLLCDQPFITPELLNHLLVAQQQSGKKIVASHYKDTAGVPVLFVQSFFPALLELKGDEGAKKLLLTFQDEVITIPFPEGEVDIDTEADYKLLLNR